MKTYAYTPQGYASPNGQTWHLPQNTEVLARCCIGDLDCDGIKDMVEAEVAWAFRPYLVFDHGEDNDLADGLIILYQAHPEIIDPGEKIRIKIKMTFTFPGDRTHDGDTQSSSFWVESTDSEHQSWQVVQASWRHLNHTYLSEHQCDWDGVRRNQWLRSDGPSADWIEWHLDETTGLYHHAVYVSEDKHGLYPNKTVCEYNYHGGYCEDCGASDQTDAWKGWAIYGIRGYKFRDFTGCSPSGGCGFEHDDTLADYAALTEHQKMYVGNIGELKDFIRRGNYQHYSNDENRWVRGFMSPNPKYVFLPTNTLESYFSVWGNIGSLGESSIELHWLTGFFVHGIWGNWSFGYSGEYIWDNQHSCFCGGHGHTGEDCGGLVDWENTCADKLNAKFTVTESLYGPHLWSCTFGTTDSDQDGILDPLDCNPLNPYLTIDTDRDGWCDDGIESPEDQEECLDYCNKINQSSDSEEYLRCHDNCTALPRPDNCIDPSYEPCAIVRDGIAYETEMWNWAAELEKCENAFSNPSQEDSENDGMGDKCQPHLAAMNFQATVTDYTSGFGRSLSGGVMMWCESPVHNINIDFDAHGGESFEDTRRPTTLGACKCPPTSGTSIDLNCRVNHCLGGESYRVVGNVFDFTWAPITGCSHLGEEELAYKFHNLYENDPEIYCSQEGRCRYKDVGFRYPSRNHYAIDFRWTEHKKFEPTDLETSLCHKPTERENLDGRAVRLRLGYPDPEYNTLPSDSSWYPGSDPSDHE